MAEDLGLFGWNLSDPFFEGYFTEVIPPNNIWWLSRSPPCLYFPGKFEWSPSLILCQQCAILYAIDTPCLALIGLLRLSSAEASCLIGRLGRRKGKRARHDGKGKERRKAPFPSPYRPPRAWYISIIAIFIGIPSGSLCRGELPFASF